ncbi:MAG: anaerobic ribonucleoside-triphosphate reductase activating protein [Bacteroidaceae bacterium]|nr:anaerobic ribonucleoside-triphosphate reductase activating protein [Bacteroidaceae bacterium]
MLKYINSNIVFQEIPDEVTLAINISNCPNHCKGCHSPYLWEDTGNPLTEEVLSSMLKKYESDITCICFMGGDSDPFEVQQLAKYLQHQTISPIKVGWYSGKQELPKGLPINDFQFIKLGPYIEKLGALKSKTTNQRLYKINGDEKIDITSRFWKKGPL